MSFSESAATNKLYSDPALPLPRILAPGTVPFLRTVHGQVLSFQTAMVSVAGEGGQVHLVPMITQFEMKEENNIPLDESAFGRYIGQILLPNTCYRIAKHLNIALFKGLHWAIFNKEPDNTENGFIQDVINPFWEAFTKEPIMGGAGVTAEQVAEWTGINKKDMPVKAGGSTYPAMNISELGRDDGRRFGRVIGWERGYTGNRPKDLDIAWNGVLARFGEKDSKIVYSNSDFMEGVIKGMSETGKYKGKKAKIHVLDGNKKQPDNKKSDNRVDISLHKKVAEAYKKAHRKTDGKDYTITDSGLWVPGTHAPKYNEGLESGIYLPPSYTKSHRPYGLGRQSEKSLIM